MPMIPQRPDIAAYKAAIRAAAVKYIDASLVLIPLRLWDKRPLTKWAQRGGQIHTMADFDRCEAKYPQGFGLGLNCGESGVLAIDFDIRYKASHQKDGITKEQFNRWLINNESLRMRLLTDPVARHAPVHAATEDDKAVSSGVNKTPVKVGGRHHLFSNLDQSLSNTTGTPPQIDTRGVGGFLVLPPTVIQRSKEEGGTWHEYTVISNPNYAVLPDAPQWLIDITHTKEAAKPSPDATPRQSQAKALNLASIATTTTPHVAGVFNPQIAYDKALTDSGPGTRNKTGLWLAQQLRWGGLAKTDVDVWMSQYQIAVTTAGDEYTEEEVTATVNWVFEKGSMREPAQFQGQRRTITATTANNAVITDDYETPLPATLSPDYPSSIFGQYALTDSGNADRFISATNGNVKWNESNKKWYIWSGMKWTAWALNRITSYARLVAEYITEESDSVTSTCDATTTAGANQIKAWRQHAKTSQGKRSIDAMVALSMGNLYSEAADYDTRLDYLPCTNGVIDLRDGTLLQHSRDMRYTKVSVIEYDATAECPAWLRFVATITGGDKDLMQYIQMQVGYSLTGRTDQQALFFMYGNGANGKTTFMNVVAKLSGEYHTKINMNDITDTDNKGGPSPHLVALQGMRLTSGSEFPAGKRINESMIKDLTGGDEITARPLYSDPFTFRPINKFWLQGNYKPRITGTDNGIWRRLILLPFEHTIPEAERVPSSVIEATFDSELSGILAWAVQGAIAWYAHPQRASLPKPEAVSSAIKEYRQEEDTLARFVAEQCDVNSQVSCMAKEMITTYHAWLEEQGEQMKSWTQTRLTRELKRLGIVQSNDRRKFLGIKPRPQGNVSE